MNVLCTCAHGGNRSVHFAHVLRYVEKYDVLTCGLETNSPRTCEMLFEWADVIIVPERILIRLIPSKYSEKIRFYNVGPDIYPRPFNKTLLARVKHLLNERHVDE